MVFLLSYLRSRLMQRNMSRLKRTSLSQKQKQVTSLKMRVLIVGAGLSLATIITLVGLGTFTSKNAEASGLCGATITNTQTVSSPLSCSSSIKVDGGTLYIEAALTVSEDVKIENGGKIIVQNGGSLTITNDKELEVKDGTFTANGNITIDKKLEIKEEATFSLAKGYTLSVSEEFKIEDSDVTLNGNTTVGKKYEFKGDSEIDIAGMFEFTGSEESKIKEQADVTLLYGAEFVMNGSGKFKFEGSSAKLTVDPGAYLLIGEAELKEGTVTNNGYVELTSSNKNAKFKTDLGGDGVFYVKKKSKVKLEEGAKVHGKKKSNLSDDLFVVGSNVIKVKRLPKFKIDWDGLSLGDSLRVEDTLNLNGKRIDISANDFRLPKGQSFSRAGNTSEYIQTTSSGKYRFKITKNNEQHTAPIGRNPYLPVMASCTDCEGVEFALAVTENVYENPETQSNQQTTLAVNETWSITPVSTFTGSITFELQWNAGGSGTVNSELTSFNRSLCTPVYWISGTSSSWTNDGVNVNVAASGSDPYSVSITLNGMTGGTEYFFGVGSGASALPVEFTYFKAAGLEDQVELSWGTGMEENNEYFGVERSADGQAWEEIQQVSGAGNTNVPQDYKVIDYHPLQGTSYYRIRQVDYDGGSETTEIRSVTFGSPAEQKLTIHSVYPNPFQDQVTLEYSGTQGQTKLDLVSLSGTVLKSEQLISSDSRSSYTWMLADVEPGTYIIRIASGNSQAIKKVSKR